MMRMTVVVASALLAIWSLPAAAQDAGTADVGDFTVDTAEDLVDLCSADTGSELYAEAIQFCAGFFEGMKHYHDRMSAGPGVDPIVCSPGNLTVEQAIDMYVAYARTNPQLLSEDPADNVMRWATAAWPCS